MIPTPLDLALHEAGGLKAQEKEMLSQHIQTLEAFEVCTLGEAEVLIGRRLGRVKWAPLLWIETARKSLWLLTRPGWGALLWGQAEYPAQLSVLSDAPYILYWRGSLPNWNQVFVGMVGTRTPMEDTKRRARDLALGFAERGVVVVSGLARGIDAWSHVGALDGGGTTLGVLPCPIDQIYPKSHGGLVKRILAQGGTLLSEYAPGGTVRTFQFPQRNRIISGLCRGVILVEAPQRSGANLTMNWALEQGRDAFVLGSSAHPLRSAGNLKLAQEGATVIYKAQDVLDNWILAEHEVRYA